MRDYVICEMKDSEKRGSAGKRDSPLPKRNAQRLLLSEIFNGNKDKRYALRAHSARISRARSYKFHDKCMTFTQIQL